MARANGSGPVALDGSRWRVHSGVATRAIASIVAFVALAALSGCTLPGTDDQAATASIGQLNGQVNAEVESAMAALEDCETSSDLGARAVVWLDLGVSADRVDEIAAALALIPSVTSVRYIDTEETYLYFIEMFRDEPEVLELVDAEDIPTSFELGVTAVDFVETEGQALIELAGVSDVEVERSPDSCPDQQTALTQACQNSGFEDWSTMLWIFVPADRPDDPAAIEAVLAGRAVSGDLTYRSSEEVLSEIGTYRDSTPELDLDETPAADTQSPAAYTVAISSEVDTDEVDALINDLQSLDVVDGAQLAWDSTTDICTVTAVTACQADPSLAVQPKLIVWMEPGVSQPEVQAVSEKLDSLGAGGDYRYIDADETFADFAEFVADEPELLESMDPEDLPTSFEVVIGAETLGLDMDDPTVDASSLFDSLAGVDDVDFRPCAAELARLVRQCEISFPPRQSARPAAIQQCGPFSYGTPGWLP